MRRFFIFSVSALVALTILLSFVPNFLGSEFGKWFIVRPFVEKVIFANQKVSFDYSTLELSWWGSQRVTALEVQHTEQETRIVAEELVIDRSLLNLLFTNTSPFFTIVGGKVAKEGKDAYLFEGVDIEYAPSTLKLDGSFKKNGSAETTKIDIAFRDDGCPQSIIVNRFPVPILDLALFWDDAKNPSLVTRAMGDFLDLSFDETGSNQWKLRGKSAHFSLQGKGKNENGLLTLDPPLHLSIELTKEFAKTLNPFFGNGSALPEDRDSKLEISFEKGIFPCATIGRSC